MASQAFSAATALFKNVYIGRLRDVLNEETPGVGLLQRVGKEQWSGASVTLGIRTGRNRSYRVTSAASNETAALPTSGRQTYGNYTISCRLHHGVGGVTAFGAAASQGSESAFADMLSAEVDGIIADAQKDMEIDFYGTPLGVLAALNGDPGVAAAVTLNQAVDLVAWEQHGNRYFSPGQLIDIVDVANGTIHSTGLTVSSVDTANRTGLTFTANVAANVDDNDLLVRSGTISAGGSGANDEADFSYNGLESLFDNTNISTLPGVGGAANYDLDMIQGVNRSNAYAAAPVLDLNSAALSLNHLHQITGQMRTKSAVYPDVFLTDLSTQWAIANLFMGSERYAPQEFPGGFKAMSLVVNMGDKDVPIVVSRECPYYRLYALDLSCLANFVLTDFEMIETDGSVLRQASAGGDNWEFAYRRFGNIGALDPQGGGKIVRIGGVDPHYGFGAGRLYDF